MPTGAYYVVYWEDASSGRAGWKRILAISPADAMKQFNYSPFPAPNGAHAIDVVGHHATKSGAAKQILYLKRARKDFDSRVKNPKRPIHARIPIGRKIKVNWVKQNKDGTVTVSVPARAVKRNPTYYINSYSGADGRGPIVSKGSFSTKAEANRYAKAIRKAFPYSSPIVLKAGTAPKRGRRR